MEDSKNLGTTPPSEPTEEEKKKEAEALEEVKEDEIRTQVIDNYGLDEDVDSDLINKIVKNTQEHKKELSVAIRQKIDWRTKAAPKKEPKKKDTTDKGKEKKDEPKYITAEELDERDRKKDLDALEVSDELKKEVESLAKLNKVSVKTAFASDYIQFRKKAEDEKKREEEASAGGDRGTKTISNLSTMTEEEINVKIKGIDRSTKEGLKEWDAFKQQLKKL